MRHGSGAWMEGHELDSRQRRFVLLLAVVGNLVPIALAAMDDTGRHGPLFVAGMVGAVIAPIGVTLTPPRLAPLRWFFALSGLPALTLMQAYTGGVRSPYAVLLVMAMIWFGTLATRAELRAGAAVLVLCCFGPMFVVGAPVYPVAVPQALLLCFVTLTVAGGLAYHTAESKRVAAGLRHDATHDRLTGLLNRRGWDEHAQGAVGSRRRRLVVALVDLDRLKEINDTIGHDEGDRVLSAIADGLSTAFPRGTVVARLGGDEFAVMVNGHDAAAVSADLDRLRSRVQATASFSAGVSERAAREPVSELLRRADVALYVAKTSGRGLTHRDSVAQAS